jgi:hypothetical protein
MLENLQDDFNKSVSSMAESNLLKKLNSQGITRSDITDEKFNQLLAMEIEILKSDGKKVGAGIGIGIALSLITGGLF